jgi:hypothetical protein
MIMILPEEKALESARHELLDHEIEDYLGMLARTKPFSLEIAAEAGPLFDALAANWPQVTGWEAPAAEVRRQIRELAEPLIKPGTECHLRLSLNVGIGPRTMPPLLDATSIRAAFDVAESALYHQALDANQIGDMVFDHTALGLALLIQPFHGQGEARAIGIGIG